MIRYGYSIIVYVFTAALFLGVYGSENISAQDDLGLEQLLDEVNEDDAAVADDAAPGDIYDENRSNETVFTEEDSQVTETLYTLEEPQKDNYTADNILTDEKAGSEDMVVPKANENADKPSEGADTADTDEYTYNEEENEAGAEQYDVETGQNPLDENADTEQVEDAVDLGLEDEIIKKYEDIEPDKTVKKDEYELSTNYYSRVDEAVKLNVDNVKKVDPISQTVGDPENRGNQYEISTNVYADRDEKIKLVVDNVDYDKKVVSEVVGDPEIVSETDEKPVGIDQYESKDSFIDLESRMNNVAFVNPDSKSPETKVISSLYMEEPLEAKKEGEQVLLGMPYRSTGYLSESAANEGEKNRELGTPYSIRRKKIEEAVQRGY